MKVLKDEGDEENDQLSLTSLLQKQQELVQKVNQDFLGSFTGKMEEKEVKKEVKMEKKEVNSTIVEAPKVLQTA